MKTNQTFIGAYTRNRRRTGLHPNDAAASNPPAHQPADATTEPVVADVAQEPVSQVIEQPHRSPPSSHLPPAPTPTPLDETETLIREAIAFHLEGIQADGQPIPPPSCQVEYVEVSV